MKHVDTDGDGDSGIERHQVTDADGGLWAIASYHPPRHPASRFDGWVVDFRNGDRVTGEHGNEIARLLMAERDGFDGVTRSDWPEFDHARDSLLDTVVWDDDARMAAITVRGVRVWFKTARDQGADVVLYDSNDADERAGSIRDAPFTAEQLLDEVGRKRSHQP
jgi:hypothetical protein